MGHFGGPLAMQQRLHILAARWRLDSHWTFWRPVGDAAKITHFGGPLAMLQKLHILAPVHDLTVIGHFGGPLATWQSLHILAARWLRSKNLTFWRPVGA